MNSNLKSQNAKLWKIIFIRDKFSLTLPLSLRRGKGHNVKFDPSPLGEGGRRPDEGKRK